MGCFSIKKQAQCTYKPTYTYYQTSDKFMSRLDQYQKAGAENCKSVIGCVGFWDPCFFNEKKQGVRCIKLYTNWLRVNR